ncbi:MAG: hypothetical protein H2212_12710 [Ruminococcus sp.]|nr:hypothetical protein [Ruminococcus sp.]
MEMARYMNEKEIEFVLKMVYPYANLVHFGRMLDQNFIRVSFTLFSEMGQLQVDFLPDDIYVYSFRDSDLLDGELLENVNILFEYRQFMIARGYSEIWLNNPYVLF